MKTPSPSPSYPSRVANKHFIGKPGENGLSQEKLNMYQTKRTY